jgi:hypothetical protein
MLFGIIFIAHTKPSYLCMLRYTSPNFPLPSFLPSTKSSLQGALRDRDCLTLVGEYISAGLAITGSDFDISGVNGELRYYSAGKSPI